MDSVETLMEQLRTQVVADPVAVGFSAEAADGLVRKLERAGRLIAERHRLLDAPYSPTTAGELADLRAMQDVVRGIGTEMNLLDDRCEQLIAIAKEHLR
jgi:hypothetical protein